MSVVTNTFMIRRIDSDRMKFVSVHMSRTKFICLVKYCKSFAYHALTAKETFIF